MITKKGVVQKGSTPFFIFLAIFTASWLGFPAQSPAACPAGSSFESAIRLDEAVPMTGANVAVPRPGKAELFMKLGHVNATLDDHGGQASPADQGVRRMTFRNHVWQLTTPSSANLQVSDLLISYSISGSAGLSGVFLSAEDQSSAVVVTIIPGRIERIILGGSVVFRGYVDVDLDYQRAARSGKYSGTITTTVECR